MARQDLTSLSPLDAEDLRSRVQKVLDDFLATQSAVLEEVSVDLLPLVDAVRELVHGGKRLRPAFCYWGFRGAGGSDGDGVVQAVTALEMFQAAALIHDDVMDDSDTRRGMASVHRRFAELHRGSGWSGAPDRFGSAAAILAGDLCLTWSDELLTTAALAPDALARARPVFDLMRTQLMGGQYLDMLEQALGPTSTAGRARTVVRYKSAKYTVEHPLLLGAALAGAPTSLVEAYSAYGLPLGEAFQLRDDVLGVFGDPAETGKPAGDDLREGKRTVLVAYALEHASPAQAAAFRRHLGDPHLSAEGVATLREIIVETGALFRVEELVAELVAQSTAALRLADVTDVARPVLDGLVAAATSRTV